MSRIFGSLFVFIFSSLLLSFAPNHSAQVPLIISIKGTCSAGKTTFIKSLAVQNKDLEVIDEDEIMHRTYVEAVELRFPSEFQCLKQAIAPENLYHALRENETLFKKSTTELEREKALYILSGIQNELNLPENLPWKREVSRKIDEEVLMRIEKAVEQNKTVLLDSWYIKPSDLKLHVPQAKTVRVLIYSDFPTAYQRFLKRNKEAVSRENLLEKRYLRQLVGSFFSLYQITAHPSKPIHEVQKGEWDPVFNAMAQTLTGEDPTYQKPVFTFEEVSQACFLKLKSEFLRPFEESGEIFYIAPKEEYDFVIDHSCGDLQNEIQRLEEFLKK